MEEIVGNRLRSLFVLNKRKKKNTAPSPTQSRLAGLGIKFSNDPVKDNYFEL